MVDDDFSDDDVFSEKAQLDTEELSVGGDEPAEDKVELDLEDAPFLEDDEEEEEEEEAPPPTDPVVLEEPEEKESFLDKIKPLLKNKKIVIGLAGIVALLIGVVAFFVLKEAPRPEPKPQPQVVEQQVQPEPEEPEVPTYMVTWEPFWVEQKDDQGKLRFLVCKFSAVTENEKLAWEAKSKKVVLRDAMFYYLRNKNLQFLADKDSVEVLKSDLLAVINQYLNNGQLEDLLIENYLVK